MKKRKTSWWPKQKGPVWFFFNFSGVPCYHFPTMSPYLISCQNPTNMGVKSKLILCPRYLEPFHASITILWRDISNQRRGFKPKTIPSPRRSPSRHDCFTFYDGFWPLFRVQIGCHFADGVLANQAWSRRKRRYPQGQKLSQQGV